MAEPQRKKRKIKIFKQSFTPSFREERKKLPIFHYCSDILRAIGKDDIVIVIGETGSGKTTQLPQYLYENNLHGSATIAITQPRRVAAITIAKRVAQEVGCSLGKEVGYTVRFDDCTDPKTTRLKYMTDGMLLREAMLDPLLLKYSVVVLDEAHERSLNTDLLIALVKKAHCLRKERNSYFKVIIMSATLESERFATYFGAKILKFEGRQHPVEINYLKQPHPDYLDATIATVLKIHKEQKPGDILVFLTGQEEIETVQNLLEEKIKHSNLQVRRSLLIRPLFSALPLEKQMEAFDPTPHDARKVILATNIAETSVTINGIRFVVDSGMVKIKGFHPKGGLETLDVIPISKAQAKQRSGRAGRECPGTCYRLYTQDSFETLRDESIPEIQRCKLTTAVLQLMVMGFTNIFAIDFIDPPQIPALSKALEELIALDAISPGKELTRPLGYDMARLPVDPKYAKIILSASRFGCQESILDLVALLTVDAKIFYSVNKKKQNQVSQIQRTFSTIEGDHMMYLRAWEDYLALGANDEKKLSRWCRDHFINHRTFKKVLKIRQQLTEYYSAIKDKEVSPHSFSLDPDPSINIRKCLLTGFFFNVAILQEDNTYHTLLGNKTVFLHPSSVLFGVRPRPPHILFNELVHTNRAYVRDVSPVQYEWLCELVPHLFDPKSMRRWQINLSLQQ